MSSPSLRDDLDFDDLSTEDHNWEWDDSDNIYPTPYGYGYPPGVNGNDGFFRFPLHTGMCDDSDSDWESAPLGPGRRGRIHDVFLSFRGEDTRASCTSHLHASLLNARVKVFRDDDSLERGDHISASLLRAIEGSHISVIVFSRNYAGSRWCLQELVKEMECHRTVGQVVVPVFYDVDPSEVRHQTGEFGNAFQNLLNRLSEEEDELLNLAQRWRESLRQAGSRAGFVVLNSRERKLSSD